MTSHSSAIFNISLILHHCEQSLSRKKPLQIFPPKKTLTWTKKRGKMISEATNLSHLKFNKTFVATLFTIILTWAPLSDQVKVKAQDSVVRAPAVAAVSSGHRPHLLPNFDDDNQTVVIGSPGGTVVLDCRISTLQDYTVSWAHRKADATSGTQDGGSLDLLTIGNSTYTLESRFSTFYRYPHNWGLRITDLKPTDAGTYLCQLSTFPPKVRIVYLEIHGPMIEIIREQMVYIAGSNLEVGCVYKNATSVPRSLDGEDSPQANEHVQRLMEATRLLHQPELPEDTIVWYHNGLRFSHRNRRRVKTLRKSDHILSILSIKSATVEDSGNYSCMLPTANLSDTVRLVVVDGEHSAAIYKNSENSQTSGGAADPVSNRFNLLFIVSLFLVWYQRFSLVKAVSIQTS